MPAFLPPAASGPLRKDDQSAAMVRGVARICHRLRGVEAASRCWGSLDRWATAAQLLRAHQEKQNCLQALSGSI